MKPFIILIFTALFSVNVLYASNISSNLQFGGYIENKTVLTVSSNELISDNALARLEGTWDIGKWGGIETHVILSAPLQPLDPFESIRKGSVMDRSLQQALHPFMEKLDDFIPSGDSTEPLLSEKDARRIIRHLPYSTFYPTDKVVLDRALIKTYFKHFDLFVGRQMIAWGTGYAFNPTDIWNSKNPLDPDAPKVGVNAIRLEIPLGILSGISLIASPGHDFKHSSAGLRIKSNLGHFDFSLSGMRIMNSDRVLLGLPPKIVAGADFVGEIGDIGVWAEAAFNNPVYSGMEYTDFDSSFVQAVAGLDYTFDNGLYAIAEYHFNESGCKDREDYGAKELIKLLTGEMSGFGRHYLFGGVQYSIANQYDFSLFALGNPTDRSVMLMPSVTFIPNDIISIEIGAQAGIGDHKKSEYGGAFPNLFLTVKGFF